MMNWSSCIISEKDLRDESIRPALSMDSDNMMKAYTSFIDALKECQTSGSSKLPVLFSGNLSIETLLENKGKWHRNCRCCFQQYKLVKTPSQL